MKQLFFLLLGITSTVFCNQRFETESESRPEFVSLDHVYLEVKKLNKHQQEIIRLISEINGVIAQYKAEQWSDQSQLADLKD